MRGIVPEEPLPGCLQIEPSPAPAEMKTCWMRACSSSQVGDGVNPNILRPMPHFSMRELISRACCAIQVLRSWCSTICRASSAFWRRSSGDSVSAL